MSEQVLRIVLFAAVGVLIALAGMYVRKFPNRAKKNSQAQRMTKLIAFVGWLTLVLGVIIALVAFSSAEDEDLLPMRIAGIAMIAGGFFLLFMYRNFYVIPGEQDIDFRGIFGQRNRIVYREIDTFSVSSNQAGPLINIRSIDGTKLSLSPTIYDLSDLLDYVQEHGTGTQTPESIQL